MIQDIHKGIGSGVWTVDASPYEAYQFQASQSHSQFKIFEFPLDF